MPGTKLVAYIIVGNGLIFAVRIEGDARVSDLIKAIKETCPSTITCEAAAVTLYLARKGNNRWLKEKDPDAKKLAAGEIPSAIYDIIAGDEYQLQADDRVSNTAFDFPEVEDEEVEDDVIHVLVVLPGLTDRGTATEPHPIRKKRWDELNVGLNRNRVVEDEATASFDSDTLACISRVMGWFWYEQPRKRIGDEDKLRVLHGYLSILTKVLEISGDGRRRHLIFPVLACVCALFGEKARLLEKQTVIGNRVHGEAHFDFVLEYGGTNVYIIAPERSDFEQGVDQACVGAEVLADVNGLKKVYSIVTDFVEWYFLRSLDKKIERNRVVMLHVVNGTPTYESVKYVAERVYCMLSDDS
ncbi:hypothetical protein PHYSODRAFT_506434 [Phytophthora sojae]|uniref:Crinkler effector protein N-terminal domain-containing protein n=1 Tax=Phytophthora sojae (strain P6497) TaxID=1094619 RepID=G4ZM18_PHYSP|nr:hypothetical protein PHYSODRAFT_506434 [Phytophthora sojae]EGZ15646.1 hypothetical protein PHYSODRAFT_506434 [Phytophthora sojae]|eukprot:XP_009529395.1 hypothetical protein PHYSODRAFT_506434 [Phytophthora sojae]